MGYLSKAVERPDCNSRVSLYPFGSDSPRPDHIFREGKVHPSDPGFGPKYDDTSGSIQPILDRNDGGSSTGIYMLIHINALLTYTYYILCRSRRTSYSLVYFPVSTSQKLRLKPSPLISTTWHSCLLMPRISLVSLSPLGITPQLHSDPNSTEGHLT